MLSVSDAQSHLEAEIEKVSDRISELEETLATKQEEMGDLRQGLEARFGQSINLTA